MTGDEKTRHFQSQSVTILAIGTGVLGFGLFGADVDWRQLAPHGLVLGILAIAMYSMLVYSVAEILTRTDVSGEDVANRPLMLLYGCILLMVLLLFMNLIE